MTTTPATATVATRDVLALDAPIRKVTLLEDRAQVRREGSLRLANGPQRIRIADVSPVLSDKSLVARGPAASVRVDEVRVVRRYREEPRPGDPETFEAERRKLGDERAAKEEERRLVERQRELATQALGLLADGVNRELPFAPDHDPRWEKELAQLAASVRARREELLALDRSLEELALRERALGASAKGTSAPRALVAEIVIDVTVLEPGEHRISVDYLVPCALWRPIHRATLEGGTLRFECEAATWQATGEDWKDVALSFSTARPTQRAEPPLLSEDVLSVRRRVDKTVEVSVREETIATTGEGAKARASGDLPGVDDGGETRLLGAPVAATVLSDGRLVRVPVFHFDVPATVDRVACPELSPLVHWRSRQANAGRHPILAGPVELVRESGCVGRTQIGFVAPGEKFVLGWGPDSSLRVRRTQTQTEKTALLGKRTITRTVELSISNLDPLAAEFRLEERVPVSEIEKVAIAVDPVNTRPPAKADEQGVVAWTVSVPARGTKTIQLVYTIVATSDVQGL